MATAPKYIVKSQIDDGKKVWKKGDVYTGKVTPELMHALYDENAPVEPKKDEVIHIDSTFSKEEADSDDEDLIGE